MKQLEYSNGIWDNCQLYDNDNIEKIQKGTAIIANGTAKLVSFDSLYSEIGFDT